MKSSTYNSWKSMRRRCLTPSHSSYFRYGGRGITICDRWSNFSNFLGDMGEKPSPDHQLDRIDSDGNYEPENCRWSTRKSNCRNRRRNTILILSGVEKTLAEWVEILGIPKQTLSSRIRRGWDISKALITPVNLAKSSRRNNS